MPATRLRLASLLLALLVFALGFQGTRGLWEPDEGRYANIAAHMLLSGDYLHPAFNDEQPHFAKPPLTYWAIAAGVWLLGSDGWGARLANALAFAATVLAIYALARALVPSRPWLPPLIYATFLLPYSAANFVSADTLLTLWETLGVLGFVRWREADAEGTRRAALLLMWLGFALAFLTKGPPGMLPLLAIVGFVAQERGWRGLAPLAKPGGLILFALVGLGWYALMILGEPGLADYFMRDEVAQRIFSGTHRRNPEWYGAFAVYVPTLVLGTLPWTLPVLRAAAAAPRTLLAREWWRRRMEDDPWLVFLALWFLLPLAVFFISRSRLPLYVLPLFPVLALLVARGLAHWQPSRLAFGMIALWIAALVALRVAFAHTPSDRDSRRLAQAIVASAVPAPGEVIFVDAVPQWGLGLYLGCEVERVLLARPGSARSPGDETLETELAALTERRPIVVATAGRRGAVEVELVRLGYQPRYLGESGPWVLIAPATGPDGRLLRSPRSLAGGA